MKLSPSSPVRYAVVGLGYISQVAALPAFKNAARNSRLVALVSSDAHKLRTLGRRYKVDQLYSYEQYGDLLKSGEIDAVFIGLPNSMHREYTIRAAEAGIHVLCEKPLAVTEADCKAMIAACEKADVRLMTAYRLHFEAANLDAVKIARSGKLGDLRIFSSDFTMQVRDEDNIRLKADMGGGPLYDIGIYCINAARMLFRAEPLEVFAYSATTPEKRFSEVPEMVSCTLRYPGERLATFTCSFGAADVSAYRIIGAKGDLLMQPAYEYAEGLTHTLTVNGRSRKREFRKRDQFSAELLYFSDCIRNCRKPEPSGEEGLADVHIIRCLMKSANTGKPVSIGELPEEKHPTPRQRIDRPGIRKPKAVRAKSPSGT